MLLTSSISNHGSLTFFTGPMCCGKTLELVRHLQIFREQQVPSICLRPKNDTRSTAVESRSGLLLHAHAVDPGDIPFIRELIEEKLVIGLDEVQLFPEEIVPLLEQEMRAGKTILAAGLDTNFRGAPFLTAQRIMSIPETTIHRSRAVCGVCRSYNATRTQRLRQGKPVPADDPLVLIEGSDTDVTYEARCIDHHEVS